jgi:hypothetical protein
MSYLSPSHPSFNEHEWEMLWGPHPMEKRYSYAENGLDPRFLTYRYLDFETRVPS